MVKIILLCLVVCKITIIIWVLTNITFMSSRKPDLLFNSSKISCLLHLALMFNVCNMKRNRNWKFFTTSKQSILVELIRQAEKFHPYKNRCTQARLCAVKKNTINRPLLQQMLQSENILTGVTDSCKLLTHKKALAFW